jgi:hypothetical protein
MPLDESDGDTPPLNQFGQQSSQSPTDNLTEATIYSEDTNPRSGLTPLPLAFERPVSDIDNSQAVSIFDWALFDKTFDFIDSLQAPASEADDVCRTLFPTISDMAMHSSAPAFDSVEDLPDWGSLPFAISIGKVDPLEAHRLAINQHLVDSNVSADDIAWLSPSNIRLLLFAYFRHYHRHLPVLHIPTWDVANIPTSLFLAMIIIGSTYTDNAERDLAHARRIVPEAVSLTHKLDEVPILTPG